MKKLLFLLAALFLFVACSESANQPDDNVVDNTELLDQIDALIESIKELQDVNDKIGEAIEGLKGRDDVMEEQIAELQKFYESLAQKIAELEAIFGNGGGLSEEWLEENFATIEMYEEIVKELAELSAWITSEISKITENKDPINKEFTITFSDNEIGILAGKSTSVDYLIKGATERTNVKALGQGGWYAKVTPTTDSTGTITVTAPDPLTEDEIIILVNDGEYRSIMTSINFLTGVFSSAISAQEVVVEGGTISIDVETNMQYEVVIPDNAKNWLSIVETKALRTETITLNCAKNEGLQRTATVKVINEYGESFSYAIFQWGVSVEVSDMSTHGTANCYIVSNVGYYKFKTTKGNSAESVGTIASAEVIWETFGTATAPNVGDLISGVSYEDGYIVFKTGTTYKEGNALIAAKDVDGNILWSWHIWFTDKPRDQIYNNNAGTMMDRNLGATSATKGDVGALGLLYQWGRKDPFLGSSSISSSSNQAASTLESWPSPVSSDASTGTIGYAISNPTTFITYNSSNYDWYYTGDSYTDNTRWQSTKTIYDPCPVGYRVPDGRNSSIWATAFGGDFYPSWDGTNKGFDFGGTEADKNYLTTEECWYPAAGYLNFADGRQYSVGSSGYYWSCTPNEYYYYADYLTFLYNGIVSPSTNYYRAVGYSVRCLEE